MSVAIVLLSGGLESAALLKLVMGSCPVVIPVTVDYGQSRSRVQAAKLLAKEYGLHDHRIVTVDWLPVAGRCPALGRGHLSVNRSVSEIRSSVAQTYVPGLGFLLLAAGTAACETSNGDFIFVGWTKEDSSNHPEAVVPFSEAMAQGIYHGTVMGQSGRQVSVRLPFSSSSKTDIVRYLSSNNINLDNTVSCLLPNLSGKACGRCESCILRINAFVTAGFIDPGGRGTVGRGVEPGDIVYGKDDIIIESHHRRGP